MNGLLNCRKRWRTYGIRARPTRSISINTNAYDLTAINNFTKATLSFVSILKSSSPANLLNSTTDGWDLIEFAKLQRILRSAIWRNWRRRLSLRQLLGIGSKSFLGINECKIALNSWSSNIREKLLLPKDKLVLPILLGSGSFWGWWKMLGTCGTIKGRRMMMMKRAKIWKRRKMFK
jgi:hypothetical protein